MNDYVNENMDIMPMESQSVDDFNKCMRLERNDFEQINN